MDRQQARQAGISDDAQDSKVHEYSRAALGQAGDNETENLAIQPFKGMAPEEAKNKSKSFKGMVPDEAKNKSKSTLKCGPNGTYKCNDCDFTAKWKRSVHMHHRTYHSTCISQYNFLSSCVKLVFSLLSSIEILSVWYREPAANGS